MHFVTRAIHAGQEPEPRTGSVNVPIYQTSTYAQDGVGEHRGWDYGRSGNPTRDALQTALASLEEADDAVVFASGLAAEDAVFRTLSPGDHVVMGDDVYGGTWRQVAQVHVPAGLEVSTVDMGDLDAVRAAVRPSTRLVWVETPTNPLLKVVDIAATAEIAHEADARLVVDNTFATPWLTQPLGLGADLVVHSTTKYLGGHSDVVGGAVCTDAETAERLRFLQNAVGAVGGPFDNYLTLRGIKTLGVRMQAHCANAGAIATHLAEHPAVAAVHYPGLPDHPGHEIAARQMRDFGGMVSVQLAGGRAAAEVVATSTELFFLAESLGGVESLVEHPGVMTHASVAGTPLEVPDDLLRLSVGIEHVDDLLADLDAALAHAA
ncbi:cystathionine gamma-synthase [Salsipaludibacter albus]|uniref:cystathionine gamma-synthase n=1 Tax=Salsipaludibacter albus TaxID=2849650 RepID=UPI001EE44457|nr:cystathionine gamma-synthase [Salsipaludibacter albus]MBY5163835.1 cystathionine gamma-synthase [Salsipaludibacter albus]